MVNVFLIQAAVAAVPDPKGLATIAGEVLAAAWLWYSGNRSHKKTREDVATEISRLEAHVIGPDGKNGLRGALNALRENVEREFNNAARERNDTNKARTDWALWRGEINSRIDTAERDIERIDREKEPRRAMQPTDVGALDRRVR